MKPDEDYPHPLGLHAKAATPPNTTAQEIAERLRNECADKVFPHNAMYARDASAIMMQSIPLTQLIAVALAANSCMCRHNPAANANTDCPICKALQSLREAGGVI